MTILTHRTRVALLAVLFALLALLFLTRRTHAAWSADPVQVHATTALCPLVSVAPDGAHGALVVWQEATAGGGMLRAAHLLANGDVDASWGGPVTVCSEDLARTALGAVTDGSGGAYVWWMEGMQLYLTRLTAQGATAAGWPARGRSLGSLVDDGSRPVVCADGGGGVYAAWLSVNGLLPEWIVIRAHHLGPANTAKDGWPSGGRALAGTQGLGENATTFGIATAADGGLWLAYASTAQPADGVYEPGESRVTRLTGAGLPAAGWTTTGVTLAAFQGDLLAGSALWGVAPRMRLTAVADDGDGGAFVLHSPVLGDAGQWWLEHRLQRVDASGAIAPGWPAAGVATPTLGLPPFDGRSAECSLRLTAAAAGGVFAGRPAFFDHGVSFHFDRYSGAGALQAGGVGVGTTGIESEPRGDGGLVAASFFPTGPYGPYDPSAYLRVDQTSPGAPFFESHDQPVVQWYGDIGLAATGDGGSIFAWSQVNERFGVFAIRMNPSGQVTGVPPAPAAARELRVWYAHGRGVRVTGASGRVALSLHDLSGREVARGESADAGEWTVPGTAGLASGVYFARVRGEGRVTTAKVAVIR